MSLFFCVLGGLLLGSFLNVCISRLPVGESVVHPRSHCRRCGESIAAWDNIPVLSWIFLRAKCRRCGFKIPWRYPLVEILTAALFAGCWLKFGTNWMAAAMAALCFLLLGLAVMDAETMLLPDSFTLPGLVLGLWFRGMRGGAGSLKLGLRLAGMAALDAVVASILLLLILGAYWLTRRRAGMGMGDVKLLAMLAAWLGLRQTALVFFLAVLSGAVYGLALVFARRPDRRPDRGSHQGTGAPLAIPFGAFLSIAGLYSIFLGEGTLRWYLQFFR